MSDWESGDIHLHPVTVIDVTRKISVHLSNGSNCFLIPKLIITMSCHTTPKQLKRSLWLFNATFLFSKAYFWAALFILYFSSIVSLKQVFLLEAIYYAGVFLFEVPSGYFSDKLGRKKTLLMAGGFSCVAYLSFYIGGSFWLLAMGQLFLSLGFSFISGTDTALHYALLSGLKKENEYGPREAKLGFWGFLISSLSAVLGGLLATWGAYQLAYLLSLVFAMLYVLGIYMLIDPEHDCPKRVPPPDFAQQIKRIFITSGRDSYLLFLFVFSVGLIMLNHIPYEFYQIYLKNVLHGRDVTFQDHLTTITGIHTAGSMIVAALVSKYAIKIGEKIGVCGALILSVVVQLANISIMLIQGQIFIILLLLIRSAPGSLSLPLVRKETTPRIPANLQATYYSMQSLLGRLGFSVLLVIWGLLPGDGYSASLIVSSVAGVCFLAWLIFLMAARKR